MYRPVTWVEDGEFGERWTRGYVSWGRGGLGTCGRFKIFLDRFRCWSNVRTQQRGDRLEEPRGESHDAKARLLDVDS